MKIEFEKWGAFYRLGGWIYDQVQRSVLTLFARAVFRKLNHAAVDYWADYGTLLGLIRDGGVILGDTDVDLSVVEMPETMDKLDELCSQHHFWFVLKKDLNRRSYCAYFRWLPVHCDIYVYRPDHKRQLLVGCEGPFSDISMALVEKRDWHLWHGLPVRIPCLAQEVLAFRYGEDWRVKRRGYTGRLHSTYHPKDAEEARLRRTDSYWES